MVPPTRHQFPAQNRKLWLRERRICRWLRLLILSRTPLIAQVDVFIVLDVTGSMTWAINGVRDRIGGFVAKMRENKIDYRIGLLAFRDLTIDPVPMDLLLFDAQPFTSDVDAFRKQVGRLMSMGGGDEPESSLEAVDKACQQPFRKGAIKVLLLITDAPPKVKPRQNIPQTLAEELAGAKKTAAVVKDKEIDAVHILVRSADKDTYQPLVDAGRIKGAGGGKSFNLVDVVSEDDGGFNAFLDSFRAEVIVAAKTKSDEGKQTDAEAMQPAPGASMPVIADECVMRQVGFVSGGHRGCLARWLDRRRSR